MPDTDHGAAVVVPIKSFRNAKERLAPSLDEPARQQLARAMAATLLAAAAPLPVFVACDDDEVAAWALARGAEPLRVAPNGLNAAVADAVGLLARRGVSTAVVAHGDLPLATSLAHLVDGDAREVVLVPDRHHDGTNVMVAPTDAPPRFGYGPGSFLRHLHAAVDAGHSVRVVVDETLSWDVDHPDDLRLPGGGSVLDLVAGNPGS